MNYKYIQANLERRGLKTDIWFITNKANKIFMGTVKFSYPHKKYCFIPTVRHITYLSAYILKDVLSFIETQNKKLIKKQESNK